MQACRAINQGVVRVTLVIGHIVEITELFVNMEDLGESVLVTTEQPLRLLLTLGWNVT